MNISEVVILIGTVLKEFRNYILINFSKYKLIKISKNGELIPEADHWRLNANSRPWLMEAS